MLRRQAELAALFSPTEQRKLEREVDRKLSDWEIVMEPRIQWADDILKTRDAQTRKVVDALTKAIWSLVEHEPYATINLGKGGVIRIPVEASLYGSVIRWMAVRLLLAGEAMGIQMRTR